MRDQFRANMDWIESQLAGGKPFLLGEFGLADVSAYMNLWYARQSLPEIEDILRHLPLTSAWEKRIQAFGHGTRSEISTAQALEIGTKSTPAAKTSADPNDPNGRKPGDIVSVHSDDAWKTDIRGRSCRCRRSIFRSGAGTSARARLWSTSPAPASPSRSRAARLGRQAPCLS